MSEVSSFCVGSCGTGNLSLNPVHPSFLLPGEPGDLIFDYPENFNVTNATEAASAASASASQSSASAATAASSASTPYLTTVPTPGVRNVNYPPYVLNHVQQGHDLAVHGLSPNATHADGTMDYDIHNVWGTGILQATYNALAAVMPGKRPFIIGRSTFAGSGVHAGHWLGDNYSQWRYMYFAIPQALSFSLFGIPMTGPDTCGFNGNTDEELCNRWMQLSAFFTFYRNHNTLSANSQEAYRWESVIAASKSAMSIRYQLLPFIYTLFQQAHTTGSTVMRALAWNFPNDPTLASADRQFMLGSAILVTPVLEPQATSVMGVFPGPGPWYDWYTHSAVNATPGVNTTIAAPLGHIPVYIAGGSILPLQQPALTTRDARTTPWSVLVALDGAGTASGSLYLDDGVSVAPNATLEVEMSASANTLSASSTGSYVDSNRLANVTILGVGEGKRSADVRFNSRAVDESAVAYNATAKTLTVSFAETMGAWSADWTLSW